jgi:hypothetical protein
MLEIDNTLQKDVSEPQTETEVVPEYIDEEETMMPVTEAKRKALLAHKAAPDLTHYMN